LGDSEPFDAYRSYLRLLARLHLDAALRGRVDPSDIVQQAYLRAAQGRNQFRGTTALETRAWLRQILATTLANAARDLRREKRDPARERVLSEALDRSTARLDHVLQADGTSPSGAAVRAERALRLAEALEGLPDAQREAVARHYLLGQELAEIARALDRTTAAVAGLLQRGLRALRQRLHDLEGEGG
jgi:RNA polymerase sigma-70 factor, ECF subfamily